MAKHRSVATILALVLLIFVFSSLAGFASSPKEDQIASIPPLLYSSQFPETQEISATATVLDVTLTAEGIFPPVLTISPGDIIRWTNQTSQTQQLEGTRFEAGSGTQIIFLPLILKDNNNPGNGAVGNNLTTNSSLSNQNNFWQSGDLLPGDSFSLTFDQPGDYPYSSVSSPTLTGTILIPQSSLNLVSSILIVTTTSDDKVVNGNCTLREAIIAANTNTAVDACPAGSEADTIILGNDTYNLTIKGKGEEAAAAGDLDIKKDITITGAGNTVIDAKNLSDRVFQVHDWGKLTLSDLTLTNGQGLGGGIFNRGTLTLHRSTISSNGAHGSFGGGLKNDGYATISDSTISDNTADYGGGIYNLGILTLNNSTVSGNNANNRGGGLKNEGTLTLNHTTVTSNTAQYGGGIWRNYGKVNFKNSIIAGNIAEEDQKVADCENIQTGSLGFNLVGDNTGCPTINTDLTVNPAHVFTTVLGPLQDNGGNTLTHALLPGSPAIDAVPLNKCGFGTDQRGVSRPQDTACDIGAFELEPTDPAQAGPIFIVNTAEDPGDGVCTVAHCSLREAINTANTRVNDATPDEIHFNVPEGGPQTIQPTSALPLMTDPVKIDGSTQPGFVDTPIITLDGSLAIGSLPGEVVNGLGIDTGNSTIQKLVIRNFTGNGIQIIAGISNAILNNTIFNNGGLAIDLGGDGVTPNDTGDLGTGFDPDAGANNLQNFPLIAAAVPDNGTVRLEGLLKSTANTQFTLEFFANPTCDPLGFGEGQNFLGTTSVTTNENGNATFSELSFPLANPEGQFITATATDASSNTSEFSACVQVGLDNISWPKALPVNPNGSPVEQFIDRQGQSRWYKFTVQPNSKIIVTLTDLPANYDLTIYKDIAAAFNQLTSPQDLTRLNAEFAPDAFAFDAFAAGSRSPDTFAAGSRSPDAFAPAAFSAEVFAAGSRSPDAFAAGSRSPDAFAAGSRSPDVFAPDAFSADAFAAGSRSPDDIAAGSRSEDFFQAFSSAQTRSLLGISAFEGTVGEGIIVNTWNNTGDFYVRVKGRDGIFSLDAPFRLQVTLENGPCGSVSAAGLPGTSLTPANDPNSDGSRQTIILADLTRMSDTPVQELSTFAARPEVMGVIVNVGADARVAAANQQADAGDNFACPYAKNLVAEAVKNIVDRYRQANPLQYVVIVGNDDVIPFFRYPDNTLLGNEMEFVPPVRDRTASQASLRLGYVLSQDAYGSKVDISLKINEFPIPDLAVGRLVETAADINRVLDAYLAVGGVVTPATSLVTGYDFLEDAAQAVQTELEAGIGAPADALITPQNVSPQDPSAWTATQLKNLLLGSRHDLTFLAGHFSASSALAADYTTRLLTTDLVSSTVDFSNAIIFSAGCHSGYNIVNPHGIPGVTAEPDWAQAFAQKGATLIAGTGYQYGDTDFIEYNERIYLEFSRQLRIGSGPVSIGQALVASKRTYLAQTPELRGLHEKSVLQPTLFGLPMLSVNMPTGRITPNGDNSIVGTPGLFSTNPGAALGLRSADVPVDSSLTEQTVLLTNTEGGPNVQARYLRGSGGIVTHPLEPTLPLELRNVTAPGQVLRGVGFRGGSYTDTDLPPNVVPLTGAPTTEIRGVHSTFFSDIFYPIQLWSVNYFDALAGGATRLAVTPAQYRVSDPGAQTTMLRQFSTMNFRLYYSNNTDGVDVGGNTIIPALAAAPSIIGISATPNGGNVDFKISVVGDPTAGIQEVWITYTGTSGPFAGTWQSINLIQNTDDSTVWEGTLNLNGTPAQDFRYMVQAVNGVGLVSLATNVGAYYIPGVDPAQLQPTALSLPQTTPGSPEPYGVTVEVSAVLTSNGQPLANRVVTLGLGPSSQQAVTDSNGRATATLALLGVPGQYQVTASFAGTALEAPSSSETANFTIIKQTTTLSLDPPSATGHFGDDALMVATLADATGLRLSEQTVFFVVSGNGKTFSVAVITDYLGRAPLGDVLLPPGIYDVNAYFSGTIPLGNGNTVNLNNDRYEPSAATGSLTLEEENTAPVAENDAYSVDENQILTVVTPGILDNDNDVDGDPLTAVLVAGPAQGTLILNADGSFTYTPNTNFSGVDTFTYQANDGSLDSNVATVTITVIPVKLIDCSTATPSPGILWPPDNKFKSINVLGVTSSNGDVTIKIVSIFQDEPVGKSPHSPDGQGIGASTAKVRAERDGTGDGRVYHISFTAKDKQGNSCSGEVLVLVPHDQNGTAIDGGALYNSTIAK